MSKAKYGFLVLVCIVAGLSGGLLSGKILFPQVAFAQGTVKVIEAEQIKLVSKDGKSRAILAIGEDGEPGLKLYDIYGKVRVALALGAYDVPSLILYEQGETKMVTLQGEKGRPFLIIHDSEGDPAAYFKLSSNKIATYHNVGGNKWLGGPIMY